MSTKQKPFTPTAQFRAVTAVEWLQALGDRRCAIHFPSGGFSAVGPEWGTARRVMVEHLFYFVIKSAFEITLNEQPVRISAGTLLWVMPGTPHALRVPKGLPGFSVHWFRLRLRDGKGRRELRPDSQSLVLHDAWALKPFCEACSDELLRTRTFREERLRALTALLCSHALRANETRSSAATVLTAAQRMRVQELADDNVNGRLNPAEIAEELGLSHDYFTRIFQRSEGMAPRQWLMRERIRHAALRLRTSVLNVSAIAYEFGYADVYLFSRQFKQVMGVGPLAYRRRAQP